MEKRAQTWVGVRALKWLIVRYSAIGDCVMAAHVPSRIRRTHPDAQIDWAVEDRCQDVIDVEHLCQSRMVYSKKLMREKSWSPATWRRLLAYYSKLRAQRYDFGLDLQGHSKTALCLRIAKPKSRLAIRATDPFAAKLNPLMTPPDETVHSVELALQCLNQLFPMDADHTAIMPKLAAERAGLREIVPTGKPMVAIAVGAAKFDKQYSPQNWKVVAESMIGEGFTVVFLGGPQDSAPEAPGALNLVGKLSLAQSMAVSAESAITLSADTGAGHIAAAYDVPIVSVFGPTDPVVFRPYTDKGIVLHEGKSADSVSPTQVIDAAQCLVERYGRVVFD